MNTQQVTKYSSKEELEEAELLCVVQSKWISKI